jgi:hypothetical protein
MKEEINNYEYLYIRCEECNERWKIAKNRGADWISYSIDEFLIEHGSCNRNKIKVEFE